VIRRRLSVHLSGLLIGATILRVGVVPAEVCPTVEASTVGASIQLASEWLTSGMSADGTYTYGYDRIADQTNVSYNDARHAGVTMSLYQLYSVTGDPSVLDAADRGLAVALDEVIAHADWQAWRPGGDIPVGANGLLGAALALRRTATADPVHDELMDGIARFLLQQQQSDGSIYAYWSVGDQQPNPVYGPFATGEAAWALTLIDRHIPGQGFGEGAARTLRYMAQDRNRVEGYLTSLPDHWAAYALSDLRADLLTDDLVDYARRLAGFFGIRLRFEAQRRGTGLNLLVRWYPGPPAGVGTAGEGIGALRDLAARDDRVADLLPSIDDRLICMAGFMVERQITDSAEPSATGAWFYRGYTQMDDQQHVLSAMLAAQEALEARE
jgi:hypothetical protein